MQLAACEMQWRFAHEDDADARLVISKHRKFNSSGHEHARILLQEVIEDWAWNEPGQWDRDGEDFRVVVLGPPNMAGEWAVRIFAMPCVTAERSANASATADSRAAASTPIAQERGEGE